jgi:SAM-dependent methyltransferase
VRHPDFECSNLDGDTIAPDRYKRSSLRAFNHRWLETYDTNPVTRLVTPAWDRAVVCAVNRFGPGVSHLDAGCASGRLLIRLAGLPGIELHGAELAPRMVNRAHDRLAAAGIAADVRQADLEHRLPWDSCRFDSASLCGVLHHLYRPELALQQMHRVLKPGALLIIVDPWFPLVPRMAGNLLLRLTPLYGDCHYYEPREAVSLLESCGFSECSYSRAGWHSFAVICKAA